jgi:hypothetical protein
LEGADAVIQPHDAVAAQLGTMLAAQYVLEAAGVAGDGVVTPPADGTQPA